MKRILLAIDLSYQCYRSAAAHPRLTCTGPGTDDIFTGGLYGFFMTFGKTVRETKATDLLICRDSKPYIRSLVYPEYKQLRKKSSDPELLTRAHDTQAMVLDVLDECGFYSWSVPGFESDDLIAHAAVNWRGRFDMIYAASNDSDLFQLFDIPNFRIYADNIAAVIGPGHTKMLGLTPSEFALASALSGTHNDIEGIPGVGPVRAAKAIKDPAIMRAYRSTHGAIIDRNRGLIKLPHPEFPRWAVFPEHRGGFVSRNLYRSLARYDIDTTAAIVEAFEQLQPKRTR